MIQLAEVFILETLRNRDTGVAEFSPERNAPMKNTCSPLILPPNSPPPSLLSLLFSFSFCIWRQWRIIIRLTYLSLSLKISLFGYRARTESRPRWEICEEREKRKRVAAEGILERKQKLGRRESAGPIVVGRWLAWVRLKRIGGEYNGALRIYNISEIRLAGDPFAMWNLWKCGGWEEGKPAKSGEGRSVE